LAAGTRLDPKLASLDALEIVRSKPARVCPVICDHGYKAVGDGCSKIVCKAGYEVGDDNSCKPSKAQKPMADRGSGPKEAQPLPAPANEPTHSGEGGAACGATSCSAAYAGCLRNAPSFGKSGNHCQLEYSSCLTTGDFVGRRCQHHSLARN
jgi:hypothetical protein